MNATSAPGNPSQPKPNSRTAWLVATCCGLGRLRPGPGSWTSAVTLVLWWAAARDLSFPLQVITALAAVLILSAVGVPAANSVARSTGKPDPSIVVVDEAAGQMLTLIAVPLQWKYLLLGFILFRVFDIFKPPPLRRMERFPGGWGIMLDDLGAGLYAGVALQLLLRSGVVG